jgi:hypothetical protein
MSEQKGTVLPTGSWAAARSQKPVVGTVVDGPWAARAPDIASPDEGASASPLCFDECVIVRRSARGSTAQGDGMVQDLGRHVMHLLLVADSHAECEAMARALDDRLRLSATAPPSPAIELGELRIEKDAHRVTVAGEEVALTALEFKLLVTLAERADQVQSRSTLLVDVWGVRAANATRTVDTHVKRLREKMGPTAAFLQSVRGVGYRFSARREPRLAHR